MKSLSVIIPAYNDADDLEKTLVRLHDIRREEYPDFEIIVSVRASTDGTEAIAHRYADRVVEGGKGTYARNVGARVATGEIFVFMDADATPHEGLFSRISAAADEYTVGSCSVYTKSRKFAPRMTAMMINFARWSGIVKGVSSLLFCHRSLMYEKGVWFDEELNLGELSDFIRRARRVGAHFKYLRVHRGYEIGIDRYEYWGYLRSCAFWLHWILRSRILDRPTDDLEKAYWSRKYARIRLRKTNGGRSAPRQLRFSAYSPA